MWESQQGVVRGGVQLTSVHARWMQPFYYRTALLIFYLMLFLCLSRSLNTVPLPLPKRVDTGPRSDGPQADRDWKHALDNLSAQSHRHTEMMKWGANLWGPSRDKGPLMRVPLGRSTWVIVHPGPMATSRTADRHPETDHPSWDFRGSSDKESAPSPFFFFFLGRAVACV